MKKADNKHLALEARKKKANQLNVLVFEAQGGSPYVVDVTPDGDTFTLPGRESAFKITRGSVWIEGGTPRTCVNSSNPHTISLHALTGNDVMHPRQFNTDVNNNLAEQVTNAARQKPIWARGTTWGIMGMGLLMAALLFWLNKTIGGGMEELSNAVENMKIVVQQSNGPVADPSTHLPIAPEPPR